MRFTEVETKYRADVTLADYGSACQAYGPCRLQTVESYDHYYTPNSAKKGSAPARSIRYRVDRPSQLTMKEKTARGNNYRRVEVNMDLGPDVSRPTVEKFISMLRFRHNFSIYKVSSIYWYDTFNLVYYVVYEDEHKRKELGRFIEVEMSEHHDWETEDQAWNKLLEIEKAFADIGLSPQRRVRKSLFEMYRV